MRARLMRLAVTSAVAVGLVSTAVRGWADAPPAAGKGPAFAVKPAVSAEGDAVRVAFETTAPTDVAVEILDAKGAVVRHLAAGVLGPNAPAPLKKDALAQSLLWDGRGDVGEPLAAGAYRVRVALGLRVTSAGTAFADQTGPNALTTVQGLATGPEGRVYVLCSPAAWSPQVSLRVFRRDGAYERTLLPFPADLPIERLKATDAFLDERGHVNPVVHRIGAQSLAPFEALAHQPAVTADGRVLLAVVPTFPDAPGGGRGSTAHVALLDREGGVPFPSYAGPALQEKAAFGRYPAMAVNGEGSQAYLVGLGAARNLMPGKTTHAVYRIPLPARGPAEVVFGDPEKSGTDETHLNDPQGLAVDGRGNLYIADTGNNRIVAVGEADRRFVGALAVTAPTWVGVHPKTGALYVASDGKVLKFADLKATKPAATLDLPADKGRLSFALDASAEPALLWVGREQAAEPRLASYEDRGASFAGARRADYYGAPQQWNLTADPTRRFVACRTRRDRSGALAILDEASGVVRNVTGVFYDGNTFRVGPDGRIYQMDHTSALEGGGILQRDRDGKRQPYAATRLLRLANLPSGTTNWERDFSVDRRGDVYTKTCSPNQPYHGLMRVDQYGPDGRFKRTVLWVVSDGATGPRVDPQGNLYISEAIQPVGRPIPEALDAHITHPGARHWNEYWYGSLVKFGPAGGAVWFPVQRAGERTTHSNPFDGQCQLDPALKREKVQRTMGGPVDLQGAQWSRFGFSPVADLNTGGGPWHAPFYCHCTSTDFDVDDFGRSFYPDQGRFRVAVVDANGNPLLEFGAYGNPDARGPELPLGWIIGVAVTDRYVYIADGLNTRVLRGQLGYAAESTVAVNWPGRPADAVETLVEAAVKEAAGVAPAVTAGLDRRDLDLAVRRHGAAPTLADAREELGLRIRDIAGLPADQAKALLEHSLADPSAAIRLAAVRGMDAKDFHPAVTADLLKKALSDQDDLIRVTAGIQLFLRDGTGGVPQILAAIGSQDTAARWLAQTAVMDHLTGPAPAGSKAQEIRAGGAVAPKFPVGPAEVDALLPLLQSDQWYLRLAAIYCLGVSGDRRVIEPMRALIRRGERGPNLCRAIGVLRVLAAREAVPDLVDVLRKAENHDEIGYEAARRAGEALAALGDQAAVPGLIELLDDSRPPVAAVARQTLAQLIDAAVPAGQCLVPKGDGLERVPLAQAPAALRADWETYWKRASATRPRRDAP